MSFLCALSVKKNEAKSYVLINQKIFKLKKMRIIGIIPARYASSRFMGKPLIDIQGMTMIARVVRQAQKSERLHRIVVATDDVRIQNHVLGLGIDCLMTAVDCQNGTERCAAAIAQLPETYDIVLNIQGDEPFIRPEQIDALADILLAQPDTDIATLLKKIDHSEDLLNPNIVKAVAATNGRALYFSRQAIPYLRGENPQNWLQAHTYYKHIGLYGYRTSVLQQLAQLAPTPLERAESLEQLRWLEQGYTIGTAVTPYETIGIDTPQDLARVLKNATDHFF